MAKRLVLCLAACVLYVATAGSASAQTCVTPGKDGVLTGATAILNTYYPGQTPSVTAGTNKSIQLGSATGSTVPVAAGDLLLIIQMQGAAIDATNTSTYGTTSSVTAGTYEYALAGNAVPVTGGTLTIARLTNSYTNADYGTQGQQRYQVVRVPQYSSATLGATLTATPWNGATGGIVALDVAGVLDFNGKSIDVSGKGFRGGAGRQLNGVGSAAGYANTDYRTLAAGNANGQKGEGTAGAPTYVNNQGVLLNTGVQGYVNGSSGRGAPGNAGGGGTDGNPVANDQNSGGGGGANGGAGGVGGNTWSTALARGGVGGKLYAASSTANIVLGGGGGAGSTNDGTGTPGSGFSSSGVAGGGIVLVRAGVVTGTGTINANGADANNTVLQDAAGGGGAGGSVFLTATAVGTTAPALAITAKGGTGGTHTYPELHGPGGGGGGGVIYSNVRVSASSSVAGGAAGVSRTSATATGSSFGATAGANGILNQASARPALIAASGANCAPTAINITAATMLNTAGTTAIYSLAGYDTDGSIAYYRFSSLPTAAQGTLYIAGLAANTTTDYTPAQAAQLTFAPASGYIGNATFGYTVMDNSDAVSAAAATYAIPVTGAANTLPVARNVTTAPLLSNAAATAISNLSATDADGTITGFRFTSLPTAAQGTLLVNGAAAALGTTYTVAQVTDKLTFKPAGTNSGNFAFTYVALDNSSGVSNEATYTIPVTAANTAPIAYDVNSGNIARGSAAVAIPVLNAVDPDGTIASYRILSLPPAGTLHASASGAALTVGSVLPSAQLYFNPGGNANSNPTRDFTYAATDNLGAVSNTATYHLHVNSTPAANAAPAATTITATPVPNGGVQTAIKALTATDADGTIASYTIGALPGSWLGVLYVNGVEAKAGQVLTPAQAAQLSFKPTIAYETATDAYFTFFAKDNFGAASATVTYTIPIVNNVDLTLTSTILTTGPYVEGKRVTLRFTVTNNGTSNTSGATVQDLLPASMTYVSSTAGTQYDAAADAWRPNWGNLDAKATFSFEITAALSASSVSHTAAVFTASGVTDINTGNNSTAYAIAITANSRPVASNVTTAQILNNGTTVAISPLNATDADGTIVSYTLTTVPQTWQGTLYVNGVAATAGQVLTPTQATQLSYKAANGQAGTHAFTYNATDNMGITAVSPATYSIPVVNGVDLELTHTVLTSGPYTSGQTVDIRFTVTNKGTNGLNGVVEARDVLPAGLAFVSSTAGAAYTASSDTWTASQNYMAPAATVSFDIKATISGSVPLDHSTTVYAPSDVTDFNLANNSTAYAISNGPAVANVVIELDPDIPADQSIYPFSATTAVGTVASYTILTLPSATYGTLYMDGVAATAGQVLTPAQASRLSFARASGFTNGTSSFTYTATDSYGNRASNPATYQLKITPAAPLPVTLMSFTAKAQRPDVLLSWATASELNNDYFQVERSLDGKTFAAVGRVRGAGSSTQKKTYTFRDAQTPAGTLYYRLKQVDLDGRFEHSATVAVKVSEASVQAAASLYPNPATSTTRLDLTMLPAGTYTVRILSTQGRVVQQAVMSNEAVKELELNNLSAGHYIVQIQGEASMQVLRLIKQ